MTTSEWIARLRAGDRRALARALTMVENGSPEARELIAAVFSATGRAAVIGLTGPPGVGKSTLADALASQVRLSGRAVAILAFDPTSPLTGGAVLGDRARMEASSRNGGVFIRSMATRGHVGGLGAAAFEAITLLDAAGYDVILVETVGAGQDEVEVAGAVAATVVVLAPGLGDALQATKAGLLEVAHLVVVNKADREGADRMRADLDLGFAGAPRVPLTISTVATRGEGVPELWSGIETVLSRASPEAAARRRLFLESWLREMVFRALLDQAPRETWAAVLDRVLARSLDPFTAAESLVASIRAAVPRAPTQIHHLGIAVRRLSEAGARLGGLLGLERGRRYDLPEWKVSVLFMPVGESHLELLEPQGDDSAVGKFLARRGEGLHHVCFDVEDIEESLRHFASEGADLIDARPRPGAGGHLVAFVQPRSTHGVLIELKQK